MTGPRIQILPDHAASFVRTMAPDPDDIQAAMAAEADERGDRFPGEGSFPTVGPTVGAWLYQLARRPGVQRVFEFGSGFGYSAAWIARGLGGDGELILTERDADELALAREFLESGGYSPTIRYELGDAQSVFEGTSGEFDLVILDHENDAYPAALEVVPDRLAPQGVLVADNVMTAAIVQTERLLAGLQTGELEEANAHTRGIFEYLQAVRSDPAFTTHLVPIGGGVAVSHRV